MCFVRVADPVTTPHVVAGNPFYCGVVHSPNLQTSKRSPNSSVVSSHYVESNNNVTDENVLANDQSTKKGFYNKNAHCKRQQDIDTKSSLDSDTVGAKTETDSEIVDSLPTSHRTCSTESSPSHRMGKIYVTPIPPSICYTIFTELCKVGYLTETPGVRNISRNMVEDYFEVDSILVCDFDQFIQSFTTFSEQTMQRYLVNAVTVLNNTHIRCLNTFIICAFDMAREVLITPKKIEFARDKEEDLFKSLMKIAIEKGDEIKDMIEKTIEDSKEHLLNKAYEYDFIGMYDV